jgi:hypothetical protein
MNLVIGNPGKTKTLVSLGAYQNWIGCLLAVSIFVMCNHSAPSIFHGYYLLCVMFIKLPGRAILPDTREQAPKQQ